MYINDIHILFYLCFGVIGMIVGQFIDWCSIRLPEHKHIFSKDFWDIYIKNFKTKILINRYNCIYLCWDFVLLWNK